MYQRVLLIQPPSSSYLGANRPPNGLGYISQALHDHGIDQKVLDFRRGLKASELKRQINNFDPDLIGISMVSYEYKRSYQLIKTLRSLASKSAILTGGPHISTMHERVLKECPDLDYGILHEGEQAIVDFCTGNKPESEIPGLIYRHNDDILSAPPQIDNPDLDTYAFPRYQHFNLSLYEKEICIVTSRGCPYKCIFCPNSLTSKRFRARSPENTVDEIEYWYSQGIRIFNIDDDNFTLIKERVYKICDEIENRKMKDLFIRCANGIRADRVDKPLLQRMKEVGVREVAFGADGGNDRVLLEIVRKGETLAQIEQALRDSLDIGLKVKLFIVVGLPGETVNDLEDSLALAKRYPVSWLHLNNPIPYPGTELFDWVKRNEAFTIPPEVYLNQITETENIPVFETPELPVEVREDFLIRCRKIEKDVKRRSVASLFRNLPFLNLIAGYIFASKFGQWLFFRNYFARSIINKIWYRKMLQV